MCDGHRTLGRVGIQKDDEETRLILQAASVCVCVCECVCVCMRAYVLFLRDSVGVSVSHSTSILLFFLFSHFHFCRSFLSLHLFSMHRAEEVSVNIYNLHQSLCPEREGVR